MNCLTIDNQLFFQMWSSNWQRSPVPSNLVHLTWVIATDNYLCIGLLKSPSRSLLSMKFIIQRESFVRTQSPEFFQRNISCNILVYLCPYIPNSLVHFLLHSETTDDDLDAIQLHLLFCKQFNLKVHPKICILFSKLIYRCGQSLVFDGIRFDPRHIYGIYPMQLFPTDA